MERESPKIMIDEEKPVLGRSATEARIHTETDGPLQTNAKIQPGECPRQTVGAD